MSKEYIPVICPVCEKFYFSELQEGDDIERFQCLNCGWKYNIDQLNSPNKVNENTRKTLNEYREWYKKKIQDNPKYNYLQETLPKPTAHVCPVCDKYIFKDEDSYDICPMCGWEDDSSEKEPEKIGANNLSFIEYKRRYQHKISINPNYRWK